MSYLLEIRLRITSIDVSIGEQRNPLSTAHFTHFLICQSQKLFLQISFQNHFVQSIVKYYCLISSTEIIVVNKNNKYILRMYEDEIDFRRSIMRKILRNWQFSCFLNVFAFAFYSHVHNLLVTNGRLGTWHKSHNIQ